MSLVEVRQVGRVATKPVTETIQLKGRTETKALVKVTSNARWKDREGKGAQRITAIVWTLWGKNALNASWYLTVGSRVAIGGTLETRRYTDKAGKEASAFNFTARSIEYLDSKAEAEARRIKEGGIENTSRHSPRKSDTST